jgi:cytochrome c-type biogenesis protein CcmH
MNRPEFCALLLAAVLTLTTGAAVASPSDPDEARMRALGEELRCLVCQNQTLADSQSGLADDLRREIRTMIQQGKSDPEIIEFLVLRYGDFVRYRPPVKATTMLLWFGPALAALIGIGFLLRRVRGRAGAPGSSELDSSERAELAQLLTDVPRGEAT